MDLWPQEITASPIQTPISILGAQAVILGNRTNNLIEATTRSLSREGSDGFSYEFLILANMLGYSYRPFSIQHSIELYPVRLFLLDDDVSKEVVGRVASTNPWTTLVAASEKEFLESLGRILNSQKIKKVIGALLAQVEAESVYQNDARAPLP